MVLSLFGTEKVALVDDADAGLVEGIRWYCYGQRYPYFSTKIDGRFTCIYLHRHILGLAKGDPGVVDHINGDRLDARRANLRVVTPWENGQNRRGANRRSKTGVRGVSWLGRAGKYRADVCVNGVRRWAMADTADEAAAIAETMRTDLAAASRAGGVP